tara:strand:+ start:152 stop:529 length:378 start_codon:yes stop_codon:yes gene_type:complete
MTTTRTFLSPNLKYKNNLIYYLNFNELDNLNYKDDNYYIKIDDVKINNTIKIDSCLITYNLVFTDFDDTVVIELQYDGELSNETILKYIYYIQENIKEIKDENIENYHKKYENDFLKYINNIIAI